MARKVKETVRNIESELLNYGYDLNRDSDVIIKELIPFIVPLILRVDVLTGAVKDLKEYINYVNAKVMITNTLKN